MTSSGDGWLKKSNGYKVAATGGGQFGILTGKYNNNDVKEVSGGDHLLLWRSKNSRYPFSYRFMLLSITSIVIGVTAYSHRNGDDDDDDISGYAFSSYSLINITQSVWLLGIRTERIEDEKKKATKKYIYISFTLSNLFNSIMGLLSCSLAATADAIIFVWMRTGLKCVASINDQRLFYVSTVEDKLEGSSTRHEWILPGLALVSGHLQNSDDDFSVFFCCCHFLFM